MEKTDWHPIFLNLFSLALRLEAEGQYNLAKLARSTADSLARQAAFEQSSAKGAIDLVNETKRVTKMLSDLSVSEDLLEAFRKGVTALKENRLPLLAEKKNWAFELNIHPKTKDPGLLQLQWESRL